MLQGKKISVIIPTLNEASGIGETLKLIPKFVDEVVIVDGNSTDNTREIAAQGGAVVILEKRKGYGRAFKTGFSAATGDILATADGDGTYPIERLEEVVNHLIQKELDFISCSRFPLQEAESMKKTNLFGNLAITAAASTLWFYRFNDVLSGMWVFRRTALSKLRLQSDSWNFSEEIKIQALTKLGRRKFDEYPISYRERLGETKLMPWKVGVQNIVYLLALRTGSVPVIRDFLGRPLDKA